MSNQLKTSATNSKFGVRKLSIDTVRLYPSARKISVNCLSSRNDIFDTDVWKLNAGFGPKENR